jgi:flagellar protein FliO/FliZ
MELAEYFRYVAALVFVVSLIALLAWAVRRFGLGGVRVTTGSVRRLAVVETLALDGKRRLVLCRRDGVEHLLLLGSERETVVEAGIGSAGASQISNGDKRP